MARVLLAYAAAAGLPVVLFGDVVTTLAADPRWDELYYVTGWTPWILLALGLLIMAPVAATAGLSPDSRWFPRARGAYMGWGVSLYLLGFILAWEVARIQHVNVL